MNITEFNFHAVALLSLNLQLDLGGDGIARIFVIQNLQDTYLFVIEGRKRSVIISWCILKALKIEMTDFAPLNGPVKTVIFFTRSKISAHKLMQQLMCAGIH